MIDLNPSQEQRDRMAAASSSARPLRHTVWLGSDISADIQLGPFGDEEDTQLAAAQEEVDRELAEAEAARIIEEQRIDRELQEAISGIVSIPSSPSIELPSSPPMTPSGNETPTAMPSRWAEINKILKPHRERRRQTQQDDNS